MLVSGISAQVGASYRPHFMRSFAIASDFLHREPFGPGSTPVGGYWYGRASCLASGVGDEFVTNNTKGDAGVLIYISKVSVKPLA